MSVVPLPPVPCATQNTPAAGLPTTVKKGGVIDLLPQMPTQRRAPVSSVSVPNAESQERLGVWRLEQATWTHIISESLVALRAIRNDQRLQTQQDRVHLVHVRGATTEEKRFLYEEILARRCLTVEEDHSFRLFFNENYKKMKTYAARDKVKKARSRRRTPSVPMLNEREKRALWCAATLNALKEELVLREEEARRQLATYEKDRRAKLFLAYFYGRQTVVTHHETTRRHGIVLSAMNKLDYIIRRIRVLTQGVRPKGANEPAGYNFRLCQTTERSGRHIILRAESMERALLLVELRRSCPVMQESVVPANVVPAAQQTVVSSSPQQGLLAPRPPAARSYPADRRAESIYSLSLSRVAAVPRNQQRSLWWQSMHGWRNIHVPRGPSPISTTITFAMYNVGGVLNPSATAAVSRSPSPPRKGVFHHKSKMEQNRPRELCGDAIAEGDDPLAISPPREEVGLLSCCGTREEVAEELAEICEVMDDAEEGGHPIAEDVEEDGP